MPSNCGDRTCQSNGVCSRRSTPGLMYLISKEVGELQLLGLLHLNRHIAAATAKVDDAHTRPSRTIKHDDIVSAQVAVGITMLVDVAQSALRRTPMLLSGLAAPKCAA
jgi:hypothetical protein